MIRRLMAVVLMTMLASVSLTGCGKAIAIQEQMEDIVESATGIVEDYEGVIEEAVESLNDVTEPLNEALTDKPSGQEDALDEFAKYKVAILHFEGLEELGTTTIIEYTSTASFDEVVTHFTDGLKASEDYDVDDHYGSDLMIVWGSYKGVEVQVTIDDSDGDGTVYVIFMYFGQETAASDPPEDATTYPNQETQEEFEESLFDQDHPETEIIHREEITFDTVDTMIEELDAFYYPESMTVTIHGTSSDTETGTATIDYILYFKDSNYHMATYYEGTYSAVAIYNKARNQTCVYTVMYPAFKEITEGNQVPLRLLENDMLGYFIQDEDTLPIYLEDKAGQRYIWVNTATSSLVYSFDNRLITHYNESWSDSEGSYDITWSVTDIDYDAPIDDQLFDW